MLFCSRLDMHVRMSFISCLCLVGQDFFPMYWLTAAGRLYYVSYYLFVCIWNRKHNNFSMLWNQLNIRRFKQKSIMINMDWKSIIKNKCWLKKCTMKMSWQQKCFKNRLKKCTRQLEKMNSKGVCFWKHIYDSDLKKAWKTAILKKWK